MANSHSYDDIIGLPHHVSAKHPQMPMLERAAQFSPFAALTGYEAVIDETARFTVSRVELSEDRIAAISDVLAALRPGDGVCVEYFVPDERKAGGSYRSAAGTVRRVDAHAGLLTLTDGLRIPFDDVFSIEKA